MIGILIAGGLAAAAYLLSKSGSADSAATDWDDARDAALAAYAAGDKRLASNSALLMLNIVIGECPPAPNSRGGCAPSTELNHAHPDLGTRYLTDLTSGGLSFPEAITLADDLYVDQYYYESANVLSGALTQINS